MKRLLFLIFLGSITLSTFAQIVGAKSAGYKKHGFVDANGNWVVQPIYDHTYWYEKWNLGIFQNEFKGAVGLLDASGKVIFPIGRYKQYFCEGEYITLTDMNGKKGVSTFAGDVIVPCLYEEIYIDENGYIRVKSIGKFGLRNQEGREIIPCKYDEIRMSMLEKGDYCDVEQNGKKGLYHVKKNHQNQYRSN